MSSMLSDILMTAVVGGLLVVAVGMALWWHRSRAEIRLRELEARHRVLEKFADSDSFLTFARSEEGRRMLLSGPDQPGAGRRGGLRMVQVGLLVFALGIGAAIVAARIDDVSDPNMKYKKQDASTWSILFLCAGVALAGSGWLTRRLEPR